MSSVSACVHYHQVSGPFGRATLRVEAGSTSPFFFKNDQYPQTVSFLGGSFPAGAKTSGSPTNQMAA